MTQRRQYEEVRDRLAAIVESSADAIVGMSLDGTVTSWNRGAESLFGYAANEIVGQSIVTIIPVERRGEERVILGQIAQGLSVRHFDTVRRRADGSLVDVSLLISPVRDADGRVVGASKIARDMSERRKQEAALRRSEEQLRQAQKMEAVGSLAGGVAHDFNNLLSVILTYSGMLLEELAPDEPSRADLEEIRTAASRAADLTRQLLAFGRRQMLRPTVSDPNAIVLRMQNMLTRMLGEDILLSIAQDASVGKVFADPGQIEQVIMNLVVNARDAMPRGGSLTIETKNVIVEEADGEESECIAAGHYVVLAVTDTGTGMDATTVERIFEPFFTTKEQGRGTGLGLSTVYGIVKQSGGHVRVTSKPGVGSTFEVFLPRTDRELESTPAPASTRRSLRGSETVLVVDDDDQVRASVRTMLKRYGYQVLEAQNAGEAFLVSEQYSAAIDLLLTDVVMPRMSGFQLAERLAATRPAMKVLYVSGYADSTTVQEGVGESGTGFLAKPLTPERLLTKIREVLDARRAGTAS